QALAMALRKDEYRNTLNMDADDERVIRYLKGESVRVQPDECGSDGYVLVCVDNYPLGWGKLTKTLLKNKYHPGWRLM
ncbi:MAG: SAM-dependent methyltransferase, partial [Eubacterium sp.]|nr:SAM-dependent methyltransferase [Eubacterium sp.]